MSGLCGSIAVRDVSVICPLFFCPVGKLWKWTAYSMEMDTVFMKDECLKGAHTEELITLLLSGPNTCHPFCRICVCACMWRKKKESQIVSVLSKWDK